MNLPFIYNENVAKETARMLIDSGAYLINMNLEKENYFKWKSGIRAPVYCNCRVLYNDGKISHRVSELMTDLVNDKFREVDVIISLATAGINWGSRVSNNLEMPFGYVRSSLKSHGIKTYVEGVPKNSKRGLIIDDLVASGKSIKESSYHLHNERSLEVDGVISIVNWGFNNSKKNLPLGKPVFSLTSYPYLLQEGLEKHLLNEEQMEILMRFYQNPSNFSFEK